MFGSQEGKIHIHESMRLGIYLIFTFQAKILLYSLLPVSFGFWFYHCDLIIFFCSTQVFICEQKLYSKAQLKQHISTGDSEVDGSESERGGFMGHPMCEFCRTPFYGDNELYSHMGTEHYKCHLCHR